MGPYRDASAAPARRLNHDSVHEWPTQNVGKLWMGCFGSLGRSTAAASVLAWWPGARSAPMTRPDATEARIIGRVLLPGSVTPLPE